MRRAFYLLIVGAAVASMIAAEKPAVIHGGHGVTLGPPPATEKKPVTETINGVRLTDNYRWLENRQDPAVGAWIDAQMNYTEQYLNQVKVRPEIVKRLTELEHVETYTIPVERAGKYFFKKRLPDENQGSIYVRDGLRGSDERLIDATKLSADQNTSVEIEDVSKDGKLLVYSIREGGADEQTVHIMNVATRQDLPDVLPKARYLNINIAPDENGVYYGKLEEDGATVVYYHPLSGQTTSARFQVSSFESREDHPGLRPVSFRDSSSLKPAAFTESAASQSEKQGTSTAASTTSQPPLGMTNQNTDQMIFGHEYNGEKLGAMALVSPEVTENGRYLLITVEHGVPATRVDVYAKDLRKADAPIKAMVHGINNRFRAINYGDDLYLLTDYQAPNYQIFRESMADTDPDQWMRIVPEGKDVISDISIVGGKLFATGLHDVVTETRIFDLDGNLKGRMTYAGVGSATTVYGREDSKEGFYSFESFNVPPTIYHYDVAAAKTDVFAQPKVPFDPSAYEVRQIFYKSKDGTRVPMFITGKKGLKRDGKTPTLMWAYGGFLISLTPEWNPEYTWWIEQGGYFAQPNLRGGGEYGEGWHKAGMFEKKQNVFDDFFAAAQYLIDNKYTEPKRLAIRGRSNGGLLMGAAMTQHPELFGAIWCGYPLLDMLRFQKFLIGRWWTTEYGTPENPEQFKYILKYSPYQNVHEGEKYPAIMFNTGDSDTRVDPLHARKMTALMQASTGSDRPILLHYETKAGHSAGVSIHQLVQDTADELSFLWNEVSP